MDLRFCYYKAHDLGFVGHAQTVMKELGITYESCRPQSIADQFWFFECKNVPKKLPGFLSEIKKPCNA